jgi:hypothetical protein
MGMYMHVHADPTPIPGQGNLEVYVNYVTSSGDVSRATVYKDEYLNNEWVEGSRIELWVVATLRNILSSIESSMFTRLVDGEEKLTLEPLETKQNLRVGALTPCFSRQ